MIVDECFTPVDASTSPLHWKTTPVIGVIKHDSKFQIPATVWAFVFDFAAGESRSLAAFCRAYNATADKTLFPGGFYQRLTPLFAAYLCDLVEFVLDEVTVPHTVSDEFDCFRDVMIADAIILRLHRFLREEYQGLREGQAGAKLHLLHNVTDRTNEKSPSPANAPTTAPNSTRDHGSKDGC